MRELSDFDDILGDDMAEKNRPQGKSKKAMTKKARLEKKKVKS